MIVLKKGHGALFLARYTLAKEGSMQERDKIIIGALKECTTRASLEDTFTLYKITDIQDRIDKLNACMGNPQTFFSSGKVSPEEVYELTIQMFLTMSWKLNDIYDRMGLAVADA
jgi:hypothetical protein